MFDPVSSKTDLPRLEEEILKFWEKDRIFEQSIEQRKGEQRYVFYDGPPFATGLPHYGHLLAGAIKDIVPRYWAMQGRLVERRFGWDCHGLPVENEATNSLKEHEGLDISGKYDIEEYGVDKFNEYCRGLVLKYTKEWEKIVTRMGRWVDFRNGYRTMDKDFMESIWWVFKQLWDKGLVYEGYRVMPFSWKLSTPLSNFEANMNYQDVQDPAVTVRFREEGESNVYFLAWTTTPWTLPSNLALAVGKDLDYVKVKTDEGDHYILAEARLAHYRDALKQDLPVVTRYKGADLVDRGYEPLFPYFEEEADHNAFRVILSEHVTTEDGSGIVHMAPAFGEDDFHACQAVGIRMVDPVDMQGSFTEEVTDFAGRNVKEADKDIIRLLKERGRLAHQSTIQHSYPFCWRSNTPLIYKAISTWFVKVEGLKDRMVANNKQIHWVPDAIGSNRFGNWLENARDWNISRNRYWGTPIPLWRNEAGETLAVGSVQELEKLTGKRFDDIHGHFIDKHPIEVNGKTYQRIPEVFDCWFESGCMPYAQSHYPFENKETFENNFPADFIAEGLDQTRGWFYTLTVLSTALFDKPAFQNVVVNGLILAADGQKMSKSKRNYPDPMEVIDKYGADCLRSYMINSPVVRAEPLRFQEQGIVQIYRNVVSPLWNAYSFFVTYANLDEYKPGESLVESPHHLDKWIISRFQSLVKDVTEHMEGNYLYNVVPELEQFIDLLTNWYIRRSRRRFWRSDSDEDKRHAYNTLYYVLVEFSKVMAPFQPFLCEGIFRNLTRHRTGEPVSVHLCDYPKPNEELIDEKCEMEMAKIRKIVELGRSLRAKHDLKVRQPLARLSIVTKDQEIDMLDRLGDIIAEELNVKQLIYLADETALVHYAARPNLKVLGPRLGKALKVLNPAIRGLDHARIAQLLEQGAIEVEGHELTPDDILLDRNEKEGQVVMSEDGITIALDTELTEALLREGDARELVNKIQNLRKEADFSLEDRIHLRIDSEPLKACLEEHRTYIQEETLAISWNEDFKAEIEKVEDVNGKSAKLALARQEG